MKLKLKEFNTVSNYLSLLRALLAIPVFFIIGSIPEGGEFYRYLTFGVLIFAAITDVMDGWLARKFNQVTEWGKIIDPLADKMIVVIVVIQLYLTGAVEAYYLYIVIARDLIIFLGGIYVTKKIGRVLPSNLLGKLTVILISLYLLFTVIQIDKNSVLNIILFYGSIIMSFVSVIGYLLRGIEVIKWTKDGSL